jgi:hypothetical protein
MKKLDLTSLAVMSFATSPSDIPEDAAERPYTTEPTEATRCFFCPVDTIGGC